MKYVKFYRCVLLLAVWGIAGREANSSPSSDGAAPSAAENSQVKPNKGSASDLPPIVVPLRVRESGFRGRNVI